MAAMSEVNVGHKALQKGQRRPTVPTGNGHEVPAAYNSIRNEQVAKADARQGCSIDQKSAAGRLVWGWYVVVPLLSAAALTLCNGRTGATASDGRCATWTYP